MKILSAHPSLRTFLDYGPAECMMNRLRGDDNDMGVSDGNRRPMIELRPASEPAAPTLVITTVDSEDASKDASTADTNPSLTPPSVAVPKNIHTRRPTLTPDTVDGSSLAPRKPVKAVQFSDAPHKDVDQIRRPQRAPPLSIAKLILGTIQVDPCTILSLWLGTACPNYYFPRKG